MIVDAGWEYDARRPRQALRALVLLVVLASSTNPARAEFHGSATTVARFFEVSTFDAVGDPIREKYQPVDQLLSLSWTGLGQEKSWSVETLLRGRVDLESDVATPDELQVLLAEARWQSSKGRIQLTLGRQRSIVGLGWNAFDGLRVDTSFSGRASLFAQAGFSVEAGENGTPDGDQVTWAAGGSVQLGRHGQLGVDYGLRRRNGLTLEETAGADLSLHKGSLTLEANTDYSVATGIFGDSTVMLSKRFDSRHRLRFRLTRVEPVFDVDSVFGIFDINPYTEARLSHDFIGTGRFSFGGFVSVENYENTEPDDCPDFLIDPDCSFGPEDIERAAFTFEARGKRDHLRHRGELGVQRGFSGEQLAVRLDSDWDLNPRWRVGAGASVHRYSNIRGLTALDEEYSARVRSTHDHDGKWELSLALEQYFGRDRDTLRGSAVFTVKLGRARRMRPWWTSWAAAGWNGGARPAGVHSATESAQ